MEAGTPPIETPPEEASAPPEVPVADVPADAPEPAAPEGPAVGPVSGPFEVVCETCGAKRLVDYETMHPAACELGDQCQQPFQVVSNLGAVPAAE
jgi:hypothetical protein